MVLEYFSNKAKQTALLGQSAFYMEYVGTL